MWPKLAAYFLAGHDLASTAQEQLEALEDLGLHLGALAILIQLFALEVGLWNTPKRA